MLVLKDEVEKWHEVEAYWCVSTPDDGIDESCELTPFTLFVEQGNSLVGTHLSELFFLGFLCDLRSEFAIEHAADDVLCVFGHSGIIEELIHLGD